MFPVFWFADNIFIQHHDGVEGGREPGVVGCSQHPRGLHREEGAQALAATEHRVAHGRHQPRGPGDLAGADVGSEPVDQEALDAGGHHGQRLREIRRGADIARSGG